MTILECMVAMIMLSTAFALVLQFQSRTISLYQQQSNQTKAIQAIVSARERIGAWLTDDITADSIQAMPMNEELVSDNEHPFWVASVIDVEEPIKGKKVSLGIQWKKRGFDLNKATPREPTVGTDQKLEFWVPLKLHQSDRPPQDRSLETSLKNE